MLVQQKESCKGKTWEIQWRSSTYGPNPIKVEFLNESEGWVATNKSILHTINRGETWKTISRPYDRSDLFGGYIRDLQIISDNHLRVYLSDGEPYNSFDGGWTWSL